MRSVRLSSLRGDALKAVDRALGDGEIVWVVTDGGSVPVAAIVPVEIANLVQEIRDDDRWARGVAAAGDDTAEIPAVRS